MSDHPGDFFPIKNGKNLFKIITIIGSATATTAIERIKYKTLLLIRGFKD